MESASPALQQKLARFADRLDTLRQEHRIPGLSVAVLKGDALVVARGFGYADLERRTPATEHTPYDIASVSKPISAVVALKLAEEGVLDLDRPMARYSGWSEFCQEFSQQPTIFARDLRCDPPVHTLRHLLSHTATGRPGERFSHNPILFSWASRPMMAVTGAPFSSLVQRYVFDPAGMSQSARRHRDLSLPTELAEVLAPPHRVDASGTLVRAPALSSQGDGAAGGVISTVLDLGKFDVALERGHLISQRSYSTMLTPMRAPSGATLPYGLGWYVQEYRGHRLVWHSGWWEEAYSALYLKVPEEKLTMILLANSAGLWWRNPLETAQVEMSPYVLAFMSEVLGVNRRSNKRVNLTGRPVTAVACATAAPVRPAGYPQR